MPSKIVEKLHSTLWMGDLSFKPHYSDSARSYKSRCGAGGCGQELPNLHFARQHLSSPRGGGGELEDDGEHSREKVLKFNCDRSYLRDGVLHTVCKQQSFHIFIQPLTPQLSTQECTGSQAHYDMMSNATKGNSCNPCGWSNKQTNATNKQTAKKTTKQFQTVAVP